MKVIYNSIIPFKRYKCMNLFGVLFCRNGEKMLPHDYNHEKIHSAQMKELIYIGFYIIYFIEWVYLLFKYGFNTKTAYHNIKFEEEAYKHQYDYKYLKNRERFSMWRGGINNEILYRK